MKRRGETRKGRKDRETGREHSRNRNSNGETGKSRTHKKLR